MRKRAYRVRRQERFFIETPGEQTNTAEVWVSNDNGTLWLDNVYVNPKEHAMGLATLVLIDAVAAYQEVILYLRVLPYDDNPMTAEDLVLYYKRFGFIETPVPGIMVRPPGTFHWGDLYTKAREKLERAIAAEGSDDDDGDGPAGEPGAGAIRPSQRPDPDL